MISVRNLSKTFHKKTQKEVKAVKNISLDFPDKGLICITGASGSGKSTLLNLLGLIERFDSGEISYQTNHLTKYAMNKFDYLRNHLIGHIYQNYHLDPELTVYENLELKMILSGRNHKEENEKIIHYALSLVDMNKFAKRLACNLSGGQKQRVGIARALVLNPEVILADEPTGNLDVANTVKVMEILKDISREKLVILVSHEAVMVRSYADRIITFEDGHIISDEANQIVEAYDFVDNKQININGLSSNTFNIDKIKVNTYVEPDSNIGEVTIIVKKSKIYFQTNSNQQPVLITPNSGLSVVDIDKNNQVSKNENVLTTSNLEYNEPINKKPINPLPARKMFWQCIKRVFISKRFFGKLFLFVIFFFGFILTFLVSRLAAKFKSFKPDNRFRPNTVFVYTPRYGNDKTKVMEAIKQASVKDFLYYSNLNDDTQFYSFTFKNGDGSVSSSSNYYAHLLLKEELKNYPKLLYGKDDFNNGGCIVSTAFLDEIIKKTTKDNFIFFTGYKDFLEQKLNRRGKLDFIGPKLDLKINGVYKSHVSEIIINDFEKHHLLTTINYNNQIDPSKILTPETFELFLKGDDYHLKYYDKAGNPLDNFDFESLELNSLILEKSMIGQEASFLTHEAYAGCEIGGYFSLLDSTNKPVFKNVLKKYTLTKKATKQNIDINTRLKANGPRVTESLRSNILFNMDINYDLGLVFQLNDYEKGIQDLQEIYGKDAKIYNANKHFVSINISNIISKSLATIITILSLSLICVLSVFFLVRTSVLARKKDIIMLRLIGVSKHYIIKEFLFETFIYFSVFYLLGVFTSMAIMGHAINYTSTYEMFFILDPVTIIVSHLIMLGFFILFGTIPIIALTRKTPANLQTENEI